MFRKMLRSVYGMSCSCNHAFALRQDVQLGEVNNVTIHLTLLLNEYYSLFLNLLIKKC